MAKEILTPNIRNLLINFEPKCMVICKPHRRINLLTASRLTSTIKLQHGNRFGSHADVSSVSMQTLVMYPCRRKFRQEII